MKKDYLFCIVFLFISIIILFLYYNIVVLLCYLAVFILVIITKLKRPNCRLIDVIVFCK